MASRLPRKPTTRSTAGPSTSSLPTAVKPSMKRTASAAQLDPDIEHALTRRQAKVEAFSATMSKNTLEKRALDAEQARKAAETEVGKVKAEKAKVENDRRYFAEREQELREELDRERQEFEAERDKHAAEVKKLQDALSRMQAEMEGALTSNDDLTQALAEASRDSQALKLQRSILEQENTRCKEEMEALKAMAHEQRAKREELERELEEAQNTQANASYISIVEPEDREQIETQWGILKQQLSVQLEEIRTLKETNSKLKTEVTILRERNTNMEVLKEEKRVLESRVRDMDFLQERVGGLEAEIQAFERERVKWQQGSQHSNNLSITGQNELNTLRIEYASLQGSYNAQATLLKERESQLQEADLKEREALEKLSEAQTLIRNAEASASRYAHRVKLAEREVQDLRALLDTYSAEREQQGMEEVKPDVRVVQLEGLVSELKATNAHLEEELDGLETIPPHLAPKSGQGKIVALRDRLIEEHERKVQFETALIRAQAEAEKLLEKIDKLEDELFRLQGDVSSGKHLPPGVRVLELAGNPAAMWFGKREADVQALKKENEALRATVAQTSISSGASIPQETLEALQNDKAELEQKIKDKEKRLLRLQEVFAAKANEFRATVTSILGWKFHFKQSGQVILTSIYDENAILVFSPPPQVPKGTALPPPGTVNMQLIQTGESAPTEVMQLYRQWVQKWNCVPGFLGSLTVQLYEMTPEGLQNLQNP